MNIASSNLLVNFVRMGYGIGYVTKMYVDNYLESKDLKIINVKPETPEIDYGIITLKNNIQANDCSEFIKSLK